MDKIFSFFVLSTALQLVYLQTPPIDMAPFQPSVEIVSGHSKVFTGDTVKMKCVPPTTPYEATWMYTWHKGAQQLSYFGEQLVLTRIKTKHSGKYYCKAFRDTSVRNIPTFPSLPVEISVDGGWAILDAPSTGVAGFPMNMTCRVRGNPQCHEVILYKDGVEFLKHYHPELVLSNVNLDDGGQYTCRASWDRNKRTHSIVSAPVSIQVLEPLTKPTLTVIDDKEMRSLSMLKLVCVLKYNVPEPAPPLLFYFYNNNNRLGPPTSQYFTLIRKTQGKFSCEAKVPQLGLSQWSEPESF